MKATVNAPENDRSVAENAATWVLEEEAGLTSNRKRSLEAWLAASDDNLAAYHEALFAYDAVGRLGAEKELMALRQAALRAQPEGSRLSVRLAVAGLAALTLSGLAGWWVSDGAPFGFGLGEALVGQRHPGAARYETAVGERSTVRLPDGSLVSLNTESAIQVLYNGSERGVRLLAGQAVFTVAHDQTQPFRVYAADRVVTATGTAFEVYLAGDLLRVAMLEGSVDVRNSRETSVLFSSTDALRSRETLSAGEVLTAGPGAPTRIRRDDVERLLGWRDGLVVFQDTPLTEAVKEMNRYTAKPIILADVAVGRHRVSGTFRLGDAERFAVTLGELFPINVSSSEDGRTILSSTRG